MKNWIDNASYFQLLQRWRFAESGSSWFTEEIGEYYKKIMFEKKNQLSDEEQVATSKSVGWEK